MVRVYSPQEDSGNEKAATYVIVDCGERFLAMAVEQVSAQTAWGQSGTNAV